MRFRQRAVGLIDQGVVSLGSLLTIMIAAQWLSPNDLGFFVFIYSSAVLIQSLFRAACGETLLVRSTLDGFHSGERRLATSMAAVLAGITALGILTPVLWMSSGRDAWIALAWIQVPMVLQDIVRFGFLVDGKTSAMLAGDVLAVGGTLGGIAAAGILGWGVVGMLYLASIVPAVYAAAVIGLRRDLKLGSGPFRWFRANLRFNSAFITEAVIGASLGYAILAVLGVFSSPSDVAAFKATVSVYGLTSLAINFLRTNVMRDMRGHHLGRGRGYFVHFGRMSVIVIVAVLGTYACLSVLPLAWGVRLFGGTWVAMQSLVLVGAVDRLWAGFSIIPTIFLRVQGVTWSATILRIFATVLGFGLGPLGAYFGGAAGALIGESLLYVLLTVSLSVLAWKKRRLNPGEARAGELMIEK